ncbi:metallophosphoesterase family protein [Bacteroidales bacterium OttesenSCG-928-M06]|nr:metallophosphoesterase family protein [Bacteroidales bacterium OttesenSCG-928-M06]
MKHFKIYLLFSFLLLSLSVSSQEEKLKFTHGPYLQDVGESEATIIWKTNKPAISWVEIALDDGSHFYAEGRPQYFATTLGIKKVDTLHTVTIPGLDKATKYRYRIYSREVIENNVYYTKMGNVVANNVYSAQPYEFKTLDASGNEVAFAVVNDIHTDNEKLKTLLKQVNLDKLDFMVFNGDMVHQIRSEQTLWDAYIDTSVELFAKRLPFFHVRGNHETRGTFAVNYMNYFPTSTGMPYYGFRAGPAYFLVLDSAEDKPDSDIEYGGFAAFDQYREKEIEWLKKVVQSDEFKNAPIKIVFIHIPVFTSTWHGTREVERLFYPILNDAGIDLMLCGHTHIHSYLPEGEKGNTFPVLVNSNKDIVDVKISESSISLQVIDQKGKLVKKLNLSK